MGNAMWLILSTWISISVFLGEVSLPQIVCLAVLPRSASVVPMEMESVVSIPILFRLGSPSMTPLVVRSAANPFKDFLGFFFRRVGDPYPVETTTIRDVPVRAFRFTHIEWFLSIEVSVVPKNRSSRDTLPSWTFKRLLSWTSPQYQNWNGMQTFFYIILSDICMTKVWQKSDNSMTNVRPVIPYCR